MSQPPRTTTDSSPGSGSHRSASPDRLLEESFDRHLVSYGAACNYMLPAVSIIL